MRSASQASRRTDGGGELEAVVGTSRSATPRVAQSILPLEDVEAGGDRDPGAGAVAVRRAGRWPGRARRSRPGRPRAGRRGRGGRWPARSPGRRVEGGCGLGQREQGGLEGRGVLDGAAAAEPDAAGAVLDDRQEPAVVGGPVLPVQVLLGLAFGGARGRRPRPGAWRPWPGRWRSTGSPPRAGPPHPAPGPRRRVGSLSTASTITAACSGETRPGQHRRMGRGPLGHQRPAPAGRSGGPSPRWVPARWVNHSAVDPQASSDFATPRAWTSASTDASTAASWARSASALLDGLDQLLRGAGPPTASRPARRPGRWQPRAPRRGWSAYRWAAP